MICSSLNCFRPHLPLAGERLGRLEFVVVHEFAQFVTKDATFAGRLGERRAPIADKLTASSVDSRVYVLCGPRMNLRSHVDT